jgi:hypothetical protein
MTITEYLNEKFLSSGEILPARAIAEIVADYEADEKNRLDDKVVFQAIYDASDRFVDSMVENAYDTWDEQGRKGKPGEWLGSQDDLDAVVARYEAMRPRNARIAELVAKLA